MARAQVLIFQEFQLIPTEITAPLRACLVGPNAQLHRYSEADEKADIDIGEYDYTEDQCYSWPSRTPGSKVDQDTVRLFIDDALLLYYEDLVGEKSTISPVSGYTNRIASNSLSFKKNGTAYPRSAVFKDRDVKINDVVHLRGVVDPLGDCTEVTHETVVKGFASSMVDAEVDDARVDSANQATVSSAATIEKIAGADNCISASVDGTDYDGLEDGDVEEEYTITVVRSSINGCGAMRLRVRSVSGHDDVDELVPEDFGTPTAIGERGLKVTWNNTGTDSCSSAASLDSAAPTDFVEGQTWVVTVRQAFEKVLALSGGDYDGSVNDVYIIECTKGGAWEDLPTITVRTAKGLDFSGPTEVTDGNQAVAIGTHGVEVTFFGSGGGASDLSIGADAVAGLRKGDKWYITVTAAAAGPVRQLILKHDLPAELRGLADLDLKLYIKDNIEVSANRAEEPPLTNFYTEAAQICVQEGMTAYHSTWTLNNVALPLEVRGGRLYVDYREWLEAAADGVTEVASDEDLAAVPGPTHPRNPLKYAASKAWANSGGTAVKLLGVTDPDDVDSWVAALAILDGRDDLYNFVPLTFDKEIIDLFVAKADAESSPTANNWKGVVAALLGKNTRTIVGPSTNNDEEVTATLSDNPQASGTQYTLLTAADGNFITNGVDAGDTVQFLFTTDGYGQETHTDFIVDEVLSEETLLLASGHSAAISEAEKVRIVHTLTPEEMKDDLIAQAGAYSNRRVVAVWPDEAGNADTTFAGYYVAAAVAGEISGAAPHAPLTNAALTGFDDLSRSFGLFTMRQLVEMSDGGIWVVAQERDGTVYNLKAVTTDTTDLNRSSESVRRNVDSISGYIYRQLREFIGRSNVTPTLIRLLRVRLQAILDDLQRVTLDEIGGQLISGSIRSITQHPTLKDRVDVILDLEVPAPLNNLAVYLMI